MNRMFKIALTAVLGAALIVPAAAQNDVPAGHWAERSVQELYRIGVLIGYPPNNDFRGSRPMTRFEFAVAIYRMYEFVVAEFGKRDEAIRGLEARIARLEGNRPATGGGVTREEFDALKREVEALRGTVRTMEGWGPAVQELRTLVNNNRDAIAQLNVKVEDIDGKLKSIQEELEALKSKKDAITIGGDINLLVLAGNSQDGRFGIEPGGYISGVGRGRYANSPVGMTRDLTVLHEANLKLSSKVNDNVSWKASLVVGNAFSTFDNGSGLRSKVAAGSTGFQEGTSDVHFNEFVVNFDAALAGQGLSATVGRFGVKVGKYLFQRPAFNAYYYNDEIRNNGNYYVDGAMASFKFGKGSLNVMGGRNSDRFTTNGADLNTIGFPGGAVDQSMGVQVLFPIGEMGNINLAYLWHDSNGNAFSLPADPNRVEVYGGEVNLKVGPLDVFGAYSKSAVKLNNSTVLDDRSAAWEDDNFRRNFYRF
ncbi:MAG: S-layer homology domain-containing protein, partial [Fimbriimonadaceae bacterium]|nr:S-layer homology domain-containing protein [Fimbriimonadaceae bacterium]